MRVKTLLLFLALIGGAAFLAFTIFNFPQARLSIDQPVWLISPAKRDAPYYQTFKLTNKGRLPLKLSKLTSSCYCVKASLSTPLVSPGQSALLSVSFITHDLGRVERIIYLSTNDPNNKLVKFMITAEVSSVNIDLFYSPNCEKCQAVIAFISSLRDKYPIMVNRFDIADTKNYERLMALEEKVGITNQGVPAVLVGEKLLAGKEKILSKLENEIKYLINNPPPTHPAAGRISVAPGNQGIKAHFNSFTILPIMTAGLIDGINPCAFTTLIFFISFLTFTGRRKKEILTSGLAFTIAVFVAYLLIGLGAFNFLRALESFSVVSRSLNIIIAILTISLGLVSFYDYYKYKLNKSGEMLLQLPGQVKRLIHASIRFNNSTFGLVIAALLSGFAVSILESICTGQLYLPTIVYILKTAGLNLKAIGYLLIYNVMFILPLLVIFIFSYLGLASKTLDHFFKKHLGLVKVITAIAFISLGLLLLISTML